MRRSIANRLVLIPLLSLWCIHVAKAQVSYSYNPTDDVFVKEDGVSYEIWGKLKTDTTDGFRKRSFLRFDVSNLSGAVEAASLRFYVHEDAGAFEIVELKDEDTWKDLPDNMWTWDDRYQWCGLSELDAGICRTTGYAEAEWICGNDQDCSNTFIDVDVTELVEWDLESGVLLFGLQERQGAIELASDNDLDVGLRPTLTITTTDETVQPTMTHGPTASGVSHDQAVLWIRTNESAAVDFVVSRASSMRGAKISPSITTSADNDFTARVSVRRLKPNTRYYYLPRLNGQPLEVAPTPYFYTAPRPGTEQAFSFVMLTDYQVLSPESREVTLDTFQSAAREAPAFAIIGGDFDHRDPGRDITDLSLIQERTRNMYKENFDRNIPRRRDFVDYIQRRGATAHLWDDHDYGYNDSDGNYIGKYVALQTYDEYWPSYSRPASEEGIYHSWNWGHAQFILLDGRFHRTDSDATDDGAKTMLGDAQKAWLKQTLLESDAVWKFIISGSVFNPTVKCGADNWCEYRTEGREIADFIRDNWIKNVVILSGDIHAGAITDGSNSDYDTPWEMASPGVDVALCDTTTFVGPDAFGEWTHGTWGEGYLLQDPPLTCWGYGHVDVLTNPHRLVLTVKDEQGQPQVQATVYAEP
jgi:alkaline phosphatase D